MNWRFYLSGRRGERRARGERGARDRVRVAGSYAIHQLEEGVTTGYQATETTGAWIADRVEGAWVRIELPRITRINKVVWGRDREGNFHRPSGDGV